MSMVRCPHCHVRVGSPDGKLRFHKRRDPLAYWSKIQCAGSFLDAAPLILAEAEDEEKRTAVVLAEARAALAKATERVSSSEADHAKAAKKLARLRKKSEKSSTASRKADGGESQQSGRGH